MWPAPPPTRCARPWNWHRPSPCSFIDTPGIDDAGEVGDLRVQRAEAALNEADVAVLVVDATRSLTPFDEKLLAAFQTRRIPYVIAENKADLLVGKSGRAGAAESSLCPSPRPGTDSRWIASPLGRR